jgi:hypothetical protein
MALSPAGILFIRGNGQYCPMGGRKADHHFLPFRPEVCMLKAKALIVMRSAFLGYLVKVLRVDLLCCFLDIIENLHPVCRMLTG